MAVEETEVIGAGSQMMSSIKGVLGGLALIPLSFGVVYYASQRAQASEELAGAYPVAQKVKAIKEKKAVYATGKIKAVPLGDPGYIKPGPYLSLSRSAEVYAWKETKTEKTEKKGTKQVKTTTYDCELGWTSDPSGDFGTKGCKGKARYSVRGTPKKYNAQISITQKGKNYTTKGAKTYGFDSISLSDSDLDNRTMTLNGNDLYYNSSCSGSPAQGCQRLSYSGTKYDPASDHTVVGKDVGGRFVKHKDFLILGVGDYAQTMGDVASSDTMWTWVLFGLSVLFLGGGLSLLVGPLLQLIEFIPFIGGFGAGLIRFIFFAFSFVFMGIVFLLIEYWYLVVLMFIILAIVLVIVASRRKTKAAATA